MITTGIAKQYNLSDPDQMASLFSRATGWGIPSREASLVIEGKLRDTTTLAYASDFLTAANSPPAEGKESPSMLVLAGHTGVGKTLAAAWLMFHAEPPLGYGQKWRTEQAPKFRHVSELASLSGYGEGDKPERVALRSTKCLVVDDLGVEMATDHFISMFDALVNARYGAHGFTVFTTNLTAEQFSSRYGERVYDRIRGRGEWYDVSEPSMRGL